MAAQSSFDITSTVDLQEVDNAVNQAKKELAQRYDFKGSKASIDFKKAENSIELIADDNFKMTAVWDILQTRMVRRGVPIKNLDAADPRADRGRAREADGRAEAGHPHRGRQVDRAVSQGQEAEEGAGDDPGRSGAGIVAVEGRASGRHAGSAGRRLRRRAAVRELPVNARDASQKFTGPHVAMQMTVATTGGSPRRPTNSGIRTLAPRIETMPLPQTNATNPRRAAKPLNARSRHVHRKCQKKLWTSVIASDVAVASR